MNSQNFIAHAPRVITNSALNPGTLFDFFNTVLEWNPHNPLGNAANITSTVICTGLRAFAEIRKINSNKEQDRKNWVVKLAEYPPFSTAAAGITQLIVAGSSIYYGDLSNAALPLAFGIGDIAVAFNREAKPENGNLQKDNRKTSVVRDVLLTGENYFAYGLSTGQGIAPKILFFAAAAFSTARKIPFLSKQLNRLGWVGRQLNSPRTTFGALTAGCVMVAGVSDFRVAISYLGFGLAYSIIPTFKSGGVYEEIRSYIAHRRKPNGIAND